MTKIAYNTCYGGFSLSDAAIERYAQLKGWTLSWEPSKHSFSGHIAVIKECPDFSDRRLPRTDPILIQVIEELGPDANGRVAKLAIHDLPPGTRYRIDEYAGAESVMTIDDYEWSTA